jgi:hypothetical protein
VRVEIDQDGNIAIIAWGHDDGPDQESTTAAVLSERIAAMRGIAK